VRRADRSRPPSADERAGIQNTREAPERDTHEAHEQNAREAHEPDTREAHEPDTREAHETVEPVGGSPPPERPIGSRIRTVLGRRTVASGVAAAVLALVCWMALAIVNAFREPSGLTPSPSATSDPTVAGPRSPTPSADPSPPGSGGGVHGRAVDAELHGLPVDAALIGTQSVSHRVHWHIDR
jgi:hypothetical protein